MRARRGFVLLILVAQAAAQGQNYGNCLKSGNPASGNFGLTFLDPETACSITYEVEAQANFITGLHFTVTRYAPCLSLTDGGVTGSRELTAEELADFVFLLCQPPPAPTNSSGKAVVRRTASAGIALPASGQAAQSIVTADFNGDGIPDSATIGYNSVEVQLGRGDGTYGTPTPYALPFASAPESNQILVADFHGDGKLDLAVNDPGNYGSDLGGVAILMGNGDGTFGTATEYSAGEYPSTIAAADFNQDGKWDLAAGGSSLVVLLGNGDGTFGAPMTFPAESGEPQSLVAVDLNGDGLPDLAAAYITGAVTWINGGGGTFPTPQSTAISGYYNTIYLAYADFNGDGHADLAVAAQFANAVYVLTGKGDGTFQTPVPYAVGTYPGSIGVVPLGDGNTFLITADSQFGDMMYTEVSPQGAVGAPALTLVGGEPRGLQWPIWPEAASPGRCSRAPPATSP